MSLARFSIKQPVLVNLLVIIILVAGILYYWANTKEQMPDVTIDGVMVSAVHVGVAPEEMEQLVTRHLEDACATVDNVAHIYSTSSEGWTFLWVELEPESDVDKATLDIQSRINEIKRDLPPEMENPVVRAARMSMPVITVAITAPGLTEMQRREVGRSLRDRLEQLPGVDQVREAGIREREIRVEVNPTKLQAYGLDITRVSSVLQGRSRNLPGGTIQVGRKEFVVRAMSAFASLEELRDTVIAPNPRGGHIRVRDVATVVDDFADALTGSRVDGQPGITLSVTKKRGVDAHDVVAAVRKEVNRFRKSTPKEVKVKLYGDATSLIDRALRVVYRNGAMGMVLVLVLLWLFLGVRNAIITALGIPVALLGGVVIMYVMGVTINMLSLFALTLCIGLIVDDAIVIVENAYRHMEAGKNPAAAALLGTKEVFWPVVCTVLTTVAAFLPLLLMTGTMGKFFAVIPKVVAAALLASLVEALIVLPSHVADFGRVRKGKSKGRIMEAVKKFYATTFAFSLRHRYLTVLTMFILAVVMVWAAFTYKNIVLFSDEDFDMVDVRVEMARGATLKDTAAVLAQIEKAVKKLPAEDVEAVVSVWGWSRTRLWPMSGKHLGMVTVVLKPIEKRKHNGDKLIEQLRLHLKDITGPVKPVEVTKLRHGPPVGMPVAVRIKGDNTDRLMEAAEFVEQKVRKISGTRDVARDFHPGAWEYRIRVKEARAGMYGLTPATVAAWIGSAYMGFEAAKYRTGDEELDVVVRYPAWFRNEPTRLMQMRLPVRASLTSAGTGAAASLGSSAAALSSAAGGSGNGVRYIKLSDVARLERARGPSKIRRRDRKRTITVTANIDSSKTTSQSVNEALQVALEPFQKGNPDIILEFGGEFEKTMESLYSALRALAVAVLVIYLILGAQFRSFSQPFVVIMAIPLALIGVALGFLVSDQPIGIIGIMGVVGLAGIVVNDSLILVDFINVRRRQGAERDPAIRESGQMRLRPIILTTVTTVGGLMPLAIGLGGESAGLKPMAVAICWGLSFATILTLYVVPCFYAIMDDITGFIFRRRRWQRPDLDELDELDKQPVVKVLHEDKS